MATSTSANGTVTNATAMECNFTQMATIMKANGNTTKGAARAYTTINTAEDRTEPGKITKSMVSAKRSLKEEDMKDSS